MIIDHTNTSTVSGFRMSFTEHFTLTDIEAFFAVCADAFSKISVIIAILLFKERMPKELVLGRILPGIAAGSILGSILYFFQAHALCIKEKRADVTALPFGVSSTHVFTWLFIIIVPVFRQTGNAYFAWQIALSSCFLGGIIEITGCFCVRFIRKYLPQPVLLCNMAAASLIWLSFNSMLAIFTKPLITLMPLFIGLLTFSRHTALMYGIPNAVLIVSIGTLSAWFTGDLSVLHLQQATINVSWYPPQFCISDIFQGFRHITPYLPMILPLQIGNFLVTVQSVESAHTAGDNFNIRQSMFYDGLTTVVSAIFGSPFPTTVYYGHQGWKNRGVRSGYMLLMIIPYLLMFFGLSLFFLALFPFEVIIVFLFMIGLAVASQVQSTIQKDYNIVMYLSLFPIIAQYSTSLFGQQQLPEQLQQGLWYLANGSFASSLLYSVWIFYTLNQNYFRAACTAFLLAALSAIGFIHAPTLSLLPAHAIQFIVPYAGIGLFCVYLHIKNTMQQFS